MVGLGYKIFCIDPHAVFFASGFACFCWYGHSVLITEPDVLHRESLITNLKKMIAGDSSKKNQGQKEKRLAAKWAEQQQVKKKAIEEKRSEMSQDIIKNFPSLSEALAGEITDIIARTVVDEECL